MVSWFMQNVNIIQCLHYCLGIHCGLEPWSQLQHPAKQLGPHCLPLIIYLKLMDKLPNKDPPQIISHLSIYCIPNRLASVNPLSDSTSLSPLFSLLISSVYRRDCQAMALVMSHPNNNYSNQIRQLTTQLRHRMRQHINVALLLSTLSLLPSSLPCPPTDNTPLSSNQAQCLDQLQF